MFKLPALIKLSMAGLHLSEDVCALNTSAIFIYAAICPALPAVSTVWPREGQKSPEHHKNVSTAVSVTHWARSCRPAAWLNEAPKVWGRGLGTRGCHGNASGQCESSRRPWPGRVVIGTHQALPRGAVALHVCARVPLGCGSTCVWPVLLMFHICVTHCVAAPCVTHSSSRTLHRDTGPGFCSNTLLFCKPSVSDSLSELDHFPQVPGETYSKSCSLKKKGWLNHLWISHHFSQPIIIILQQHLASTFLRPNTFLLSQCTCFPMANIGAICLPCTYFPAQRT